MVIDGDVINAKNSSLVNDNELYDKLKSLKVENLTSKGVVVFDSKMTVLPLISEWLSYSICYKLMPASTANTYGKNLSYFISYLQRTKPFNTFEADSALLDIQSHTISEYIAYLKNQRGCKASTIRNRDASCMQMFNDFLCVDRIKAPPLRETNPYAGGYLSPSANNSNVEMCKIEELVALIRSTKHERERSLIQFMYDSGVRRAEVCKITKRQVSDAFNFEKNTAIINDNTFRLPSEYKPLRLDGVKGRNGVDKERITIVSNTTLERVIKYNSSPLYRRYNNRTTSKNVAFLNAEGNPYTPGSISKLFTRLSNRAIKRGELDKQIPPHMLRHGFAGSVLCSPDLGKDAIERLFIVKECLGHVFLTTTQKYTKLPYEIYRAVVSDDGRKLTRAEIMQRVRDETKLKIGMTDKK